MKNLIYLLSLVLLPGCKAPSGKQAKDQQLNIVATTGMLYDAVVSIAGDKVQASALMGPGVDPHLYKATQGDLAQLRQADIIIYNGLLLEGKMGDILEKLGRNKPVLAAAEAIPAGKLRTAAHDQDAYDPHVWFDVSLWKYVVENIAGVLQQEDTLNASFYRENAQRYLQALDTLHAYVKNKISTIPAHQRILVTAHDAFGYFGDAYDIRVEGLQGISTVSDFGLRDITDITELIIRNQVKAIFVETSVSDRAIRAVITGCREKGHEVVIGGRLYSDAMGAYGTFEGTYIGMVKKNVDTITGALK